MSNRSPEREQFYADIISTAVEGGIGYWSQVSHYQWVKNWGGDQGKLMVVCGDDDDYTDKGTMAVVHEYDPDTDDYAAEGMTLDTDKIAIAMGRITGESGLIGKYAANQITGALRDLDAGEIDSDLADVIVQVALLGEEVYA